MIRSKKILRENFLSSRSVEYLSSEWDWRKRLEFIRCWCFILPPTTKSKLHAAVLIRFDLSTNFRRKKDKKALDRILARQINCCITTESHFYGLGSLKNRVTRINFILGRKSIVISTFFSLLPNASLSINWANFIRSKKSDEHDQVAIFWSSLFCKMRRFRFGEKSPLIRLPAKCVTKWSIFP